MPQDLDVAVIGGGPAGLRAAEVAAASGSRTAVFDAKPSVGRKFLVAGRGGLNLTHAEPLENFLGRYRGPDLPAAWTGFVRAFSPDALRAWAAGLGVETFAASTGRVYPRALKGAPLLRAWIHRLRALGVTFHLRHRWTGLSAADLSELTFATPDGSRSVSARAVVLALGGGSWPETGSDGAWVETLQRAGVAVAPLEPANCGWEVDWPAGLLAEAEGRPLKNLRVSAAGVTAAGEVIVTRYGLEGGPIYQLGAVLRGMTEPELRLDFKPDVPAEALLRRLGPVRRNFAAEAAARWRLGAAASLLRHAPAPSSAEETVQLVKSFPVRLLRPRPLAEAISSAGGVRWAGVDHTLMLNRHPGIFCAGEMLDWEAPTGGYLLQGCFASGTQAGQSAAAWARRVRPAGVR